MLKIDGIQIAQRQIDYALRVDGSLGDDFDRVIFCDNKTEALSLGKAIGGSIVVVQYIFVSYWYNLLTGEIVYDGMEE